MNNASDTILVQAETGTFRLVKDQDKYESFWVCDKGHFTSTLQRYVCKNMVVPMAMSIELYSLAREQGYTDDQLATPKRPVKEPTTGAHKRHTPKGTFNIKIKVLARI